MREELTKTKLLPIQGKDMDSIMQNLETGVAELFSSDRYQDYLKTMSKFHNYSFNNTVLIAMQRPDSEWVCRALAFGKNVLVEKPMCINKIQYQEIQKFSKGNDKFILEGLMILRHPWIEQVRKIVESKKYGEVIKCKTNITMQIPQKMEDGFRSKEYLGGGVLIDEAPYWISIIQHIFHEELINISEKEIEKKNNVIYAAKLIGQIQNTDIEFYCSYHEKYSSDFCLQMERASLYVKNFFRASMGEFKITIDINGEIGNEKIVFPKQNYYQNQLQYFYNNTDDQDKKYLEMKEAGQRVHTLEKILKSLK